jgi:multidrug resistance protein, MATE family
MNTQAKTASKPLTRFAPAGILELLWVSVPLILSLVSGAIMLIVDRKFLAHFSTSAMNGAVAANMPVWTFQISAVTLASIAQVFVGQFNGANQYKKIGSAVWQMIWFCAYTIPLFVLLGLFGDSIFFNGSSVRAEATEYFRWMMTFGFLAPLSAAISCFFVGRGKTLYVLFCTLVGNLINVGFNCLLIFGVDGVISPMGAAGAAIATLIGMAIQLLMLACVFLNKKNREQFGTNDYTYDPVLFKQSLSIGFPAALDRFINVLGWTTFILLIDRLGPIPLTVITITQSMMLFFTFISQGIGRGVSSIAANCIGSRNWKHLWKLILSALTLNGILFIVYGVFFMVYPDVFAKLFLPDNVATASRDEILRLTLISCGWLWFAVLVDACRWVFIGLLTAVGDTRFVMWMGSVSVWFFAIIPTYIFVVHFGVPVSFSWAFSAGYYLVLTCVYAWRFSREKWKEKLLIDEEVAA